MALCWMGDDQCHADGLYGCGKDGSYSGQELNVTRSFQIKKEMIQCWMGDDECHADSPCGCRKEGLGSGQETNAIDVFYEQKHLREVEHRARLARQMNQQATTPHQYFLVLCVMPPMCIQC